MSNFVIPTGGCIKCAKCEQIRTSFFCNGNKLTQKQVFNAKGYCPDFTPAGNKEVRKMTDSEIIARLHKTNKNRRNKILYPVAYFAVVDGARDSGMSMWEFCIDVVGISKSCFSSMVTGQFSTSKYAIDQLLDATGLTYEEAFKIYD